jgi:hypothetical protein
MTATVVILIQGGSDDVTGRTVHNSEEGTTRMADVSRDAPGGTRRDRACPDRRAAAGWVASLRDRWFAAQARAVRGGLVSEFSLEVPFLYNIPIQADPILERIQSRTERLSPAHDL